MNERVWSVGELTRRIKDLLEVEIDRVWVRGEVSGWKIHPSSGHAYFNLKDERALIACTLWAQTLRRLSVRPQEGMRLRALGQVSVYEPRGSYQLNVQQVVPDGEGELQAAFLALKRRLEAEGLFDPSRKRPLPRVPRAIGIVTSPSGAALRDMLRILSRRWPAVEVVLRGAAVQGAQAAQDVADGIAELNRVPGLDLLIVGRGGGSLEDLWAFNEEVVARAIHASALPVISAVGHEVDVTIADFVADVRAATPTHAAELAVPDRDEVARRLLRDRSVLDVGLRTKLEKARLRLERCGASRGFRGPESLLVRSRLDLDRLFDRLRRSLARPAERGRGFLRTLEVRLLKGSPERTIAAHRRRVDDALAHVRRAGELGVSRARARLDLAEARLHSLAPERVLARGYGIVRREPAGAILRLASDAATGDLLSVTLHRGGLRCRVETVDAGSPSGGPSAGRRGDAET